MLDLDLTNDEVKSFDVLPKGDYMVRIDKAELKESKNNSANQYINLELTVMQGKYEDRKVFSMINIINQNEKAAAIGRSQLKQLLIATGEAKEGDKIIFKDPAVLVMNTCVATVGIQTQEGFEPKNVVKAYKKKAIQNLDQAITGKKGLGF